MYKTDHCVIKFRPVFKLVFNLNLWVVCVYFIIKVSELQKLTNLIEINYIYIILIILSSVHYNIMYR